MIHILVVDDSSTDRFLAGQLIERTLGMSVEYACDGIQAVEHIENVLPLAVVTDLLMPDMDGLKLVEEVHRRFPTVPVILMTAHGSDDIALQALMKGAADYVSKARLSEQLPAAVKRVLAAAAGNRTYERLAPCLRYLESRYELENDPRLIPPLVDELQWAAYNMGLVNSQDRVRLARALEESLSNAVYHGNLELSTAELKKLNAEQVTEDEPLALRRAQSPFCDRRVHVHGIVSPQELRFTVRDDGKGFDTSKVPDVNVAPALLSHGDGRGLVLIRVFVDEVTFNAAGNEITLVKRARPAG